MLGGETAGASGPVVLHAGAGGAVEDTTLGIVVGLAVGVGYYLVLRIAVGE